MPNPVLTPSNLPAPSTFPKPDCTFYPLLRDDKASHGESTKSTPLL